ncbi:pyridoxal phosphate-dependent aminotransferase [Chryseobacterium aquaticum]|uniref:cysteine-S-conjugate beta-lyase n=1 Tax=Chryseobacterium aquaticum TaxID=452084 RepID=A0A848N7D7_9FLAO|nr:MULTISPECIES: MalY/PatB family protein [Chryseobacterium]NMR34391.1 pyridoxal phosphate-dependent aminotransferase [Chryseobacterium aquaticum]NRQ46625.1 pyridoxal phosphate-dependent aminotransferase [Chryseobacterium sp. C-204]
MKYNFDEIISRKNTNSVKWDLAKDVGVLPMWVADMDFKTAPEILETISEKVSHGIFGYSDIPDNFHQSIIDWWKNNHDFYIEKEWLLPVTGMIVSLSAIVRTFVKPDENIILQTPVYNHFFTIAENCSCNILENDLIYKDGSYKIDFDDLEAKASKSKTKLLLMSNPHNPVGRVWKKEELVKIAEICSKHQVMVVSDEIHADLVFENHKHIPFASIAANYDLDSVTCGSPCKTFNLSGLSISYIISQDKHILKQINKTLEIQETIYPNPIAADALIAAYTKGNNWLKEMKIYLWENYQFLLKFCGEHLPEIKVISLEATYLVWLDFSFFNKTSDEISKILIEEEKLWLNSGTMYGKAGEGFLRMNIACPRELLAKGLKRLEKFYLKNI